MERLSNRIKSYKFNELELEKEYDKNNDNDTFNTIVTSLDLQKKELMKYTSKLEISASELRNCKKCKNILSCSNEITGYLYYPNNENDRVVFSYIPCKYKRELDKKNKYQKHVYLFDQPKEIKNASMKDIHTDDKSRVETIKWIKNFLDNYVKQNQYKGLYLTGNFGCGKTYIVSAMLNELAKKGSNVAIIYYPEFLRSLKSSFNDDEEFNYRFNYIKKVELLLIDDIGAEITTPWSRDEILGSILQYRMQEGLPTFFTSNLNINELEEHLANSSSGIDKVKARRIIERIKQMTDNIIMISENKRK